MEYTDDVRIWTRREIQESTKGMDFILMGNENENGGILKISLHNSRRVSKDHQREAGMQEKAIYLV